MRLCRFVSAKDATFKYTAGKQSVRHVGCVRNCLLPENLVLLQWNLMFCPPPRGAAPMKAVRMAAVASWGHRPPAGGRMRSTGERPTALTSGDAGWAGEAGEARLGWAGEAFHSRSSKGSSTPVSETGDWETAMSGS